MANLLGFLLRPSRNKWLDKPVADAADNPFDYYYWTAVPPYTFRIYSIHVFWQSLGGSMTNDDIPSMINAIIHIKPRYSQSRLYYSKQRTMRTPLIAKIHDVTAVPVSYQDNPEPQIDIRITPDMPTRFVKGIDMQGWLQFTFAFGGSKNITNVTTVSGAWITIEYDIIYNPDFISDNLFSD